MRLVNLEKERIRRGWTQEDVAARIGVARSTYANWENGKREPDFDSIQKLAELFEVSIDYLVGRNSIRINDHADPDVQFIARAKQELSPKAFQKMMELAKKAKEMFEDEDDED